MHAQAWAAIQQLGAARHTRKHHLLQSALQASTRHCKGTVPHLSRGAFDKHLLCRSLQQHRQACTITSHSKLALSACSLLIQAAQRPVLSQQANLEFCRWCGAALRPDDQHHRRDHAQRLCRHLVVPLLS